MLLLRHTYTHITYLSVCACKNRCQNSYLLTKLSNTSSLKAVLKSKLCIFWNIHEVIIYFYMQ